MLKKVVLTVFVTMLIAFGAGISYANQVDGMASGTGPALPTGIQSSINPGGLGDSLLYGYYNVRGNLDLFNIVNTDTANGAKVRVIFRNAKNSKECLDFSVCLSKGDVWTAYLIDNGTTAAICPYDTDTLTAPIIPSSCQPFKDGTYGDGYVVLPDDCREGYFEVVGLVAIPGYDKNDCSKNPRGTGCVISDEIACRDYAGTTSVSNTLMGNNTIVELTNTLATYSYNATAIADTSLGVPPTPKPGKDYDIPNTMDNGCSEADYILTKSSIISPFDLISAIGGETELIVTFPTRLACHKDESGGIFDGVSGNTDGAKADSYCTKITPYLWDDKEHRQQVTEFSPGLELCLPYEVNVIKLGGSQIWNSTVAKVIATSFELGWIEIDFTATGHSVNYGGNVSSGLPAVAYTTQSFAGGAASYMVPTAYRTNITIP